MTVDDERENKLLYILLYISTISRHTILSEQQVHFTCMFESNIKIPILLACRAVWGRRGLDFWTEMLWLFFFGQ